MKFHKDIWFIIKDCHFKLRKISRLNVNIVISNRIWFSSGLAKLLLFIIMLLMWLILHVYFLMCLTWWTYCSNVFAMSHFPFILKKEREIASSKLHMHKLCLMGQEKKRSSLFCCHWNILWRDALGAGASLGSTQILADVSEVSSEMNLWSTLNSSVQSLNLQFIISENSSCVFYYCELKVVKKSSLFGIAFGMFLTSWLHVGQGGAYFSLNREWKLHI